MATTGVRGTLSLWTTRFKAQLVSLALLNSYIWAPFGKYACVPVLNCYACTLATTACPIGSLSNFLVLSQIPYYIIGTLGVMGATVGRFFCGWACPFGWLQDLLYRIRTRKFSLFRGANALKYVMLIVLVIAVPMFLEKSPAPPPPPVAAEAQTPSEDTELPDWVKNKPGAPRVAEKPKPVTEQKQEESLTGSDRVVRQDNPSYDYCALICPAGTLEAGLPALLINDKVREGMTWKSWLKLSILALVLALMIFSRRSFCRTLCPLGAVMAICSRLSLLRLETDQSKCTHCQACVSACPTRARQVPEETRRKEATAECLNCLDCVKVCPEPEALCARLGTHAIMVSRGQTPVPQPPVEEKVGAS